MRISLLASVPGRWVLAAEGVNCNTACGGKCNAAEQSKVTSRECMNEAMIKATGKPCNWGVNPVHRGYAGSPFYFPPLGSTGVGDECYYLTTPGATSVCDDLFRNGLSMRALCYCNCKFCRY